MKAKKKKTNIALWTLLFLLLLLVGGLATYLVIRKINKPVSYVYKGFEIPLPIGFEVHGIDVSRYQDNIDWEKVKAMQSDGVTLDFAIIKATEGASLVDPKFRRNWLLAKENGIIRGAYHFYRPGRDPVLQAENFLAIVKTETGDLPPVLDIEVEDSVRKPELVREIQTWLTIVESRLKVKPVIYTNANFYQRNLAGLFDNYPLWVAHYFALGTGPRVERKWHLWQHSEKGRVNGIAGFVDFNVFAGSKKDFDSLRIRNSLQSH